MVSLARWLKESAQVVQLELQFQSPTRIGHMFLFPTAAHSTCGECVQYLSGGRDRCRSAHSYLELERASGTRDTRLRSYFTLFYFPDSLLE